MKYVKLVDSSKSSATAALNTRISVGDVPYRVWNQYRHSNQEKVFAMRYWHYVADGVRRFEEILIGMTVLCTGLPNIGQRWRFIKTFSMEERAKTNIQTKYSFSKLKKLTEGKPVPIISVRNPIVIIGYMSANNFLMLCLNAKRFSEKIFQIPYHLNVVFHSNKM